MLNTKIASRKPDKTGRIDVTAARLRLNLANPQDLEVHHYIQELKEKRECKAAMMRGLETEHDLETGNFAAIAEREPALVDWILREYGGQTHRPAPQADPLPPLEPEPSNTDDAKYNTDDLDDPNLEEFLL